MVEPLVAGVMSTVRANASVIVEEEVGRARLLTCESESLERKVVDQVAKRVALRLLHDTTEHLIALASVLSSEATSVAVS